MEFIEGIDRGGFGQVDKVRLPDGSIVARKTFDPAPGVEANIISKLRKRFLRELKVQLQLPQEFFIPVLDYDESGDNPWYTMPLADSNYLDEIERQRAASDPDAEPLADILSALEELHRLGFVHRDLKPANVLLHDGTWKLADMGLVLPTSGQTTQLSTTHSAWGTHAYCAPEQVLDFSHVSATADIYSFGCVLHDLFDGSARVPYKRHTCSGPLGPIVEKCTEEDSSKRFKTVATLRGALMGVLAQPQALAQTTPETDEWLQALAEREDWTAKEVEDLARFVCGNLNVADLWQLCQALKEDQLAALHHAEPDYWERIAEEYCQWARECAFPFDYCDVVVMRLVRIFELGSTGVKALAALAAAYLGAGHNRYFVMGRLLGICGGDLDDDVARRIAIEIQAEEAGGRFRACAAVIRRKVNEYHPEIARVLEEEEEEIVD